MNDMEMEMRVLILIGSICLRMAVLMFFFVHALKPNTLLDPINCYTITDGKLKKANSPLNANKNIWLLWIATRRKCFLWSILNDFPLRAHAVLLALTIAAASLSVAAAVASTDLLNSSARWYKKSEPIDVDSKSFDSSVIWLNWWFCARRLICETARAVYAAQSMHK